MTTMTTAEVLQQLDVTATAWRLTLNAANGKRVRRRSAMRTLIAAGADPEAAATLTEVAVDVANARKAATPPTLVERAKAVIRADQRK